MLRYFGESHGDNSDYALNHIICVFGTSHNHTNYTGSYAGNDVVHAAPSSLKSRIKCHYSVTLRTEISAICKTFLTSSLTKPSYNVEETLKNCELFVYGDVSYITIGGTRWRGRLRQKAGSSRALFCHWNFLWKLSFRPHSASNRNEYQEYFVGT
jgi:hypothetical protein